MTARKCILLSKVQDENAVTQNAMAQSPLFSYFFPIFLATPNTMDIGQQFIFVKEGTTYV